MKAMTKAEALWRPTQPTQPGDWCPYGLDPRTDHTNHRWETEAEWTTLQAQARALVVPGVPQAGEPVTVQYSIQLHEECCRRTRCFDAGHPEWFTEW